MRKIYGRKTVEIIGTRAERLSLLANADKIEDNCEFYETDTKTVYAFIGTAWVPYENHFKGLPYRFFMTQAGNNTGEINLIGNYSAAPVDFYYEAVDRFEVITFLITISSSNKFNQTDYADIIGGLTNGVGIFIKPAGQAEIRLLTNSNIKVNHEWYRLTEHIQLTSFFGNPQTLSMNINLVEDFGSSLTLNAGDRLIVRLNDNFSTLVSQTFMIRGERFFV